MTLETQAAFAARIGKDKSHVTRLKQNGRLVMREGRVDVEASLERIGETQSFAPHHIANSDRLALERQAPGAADPVVDLSLKKQAAQLRKLEADAAVAEYQRGKIEGTLCHVDTVKRAAKRHGDIVRRHLEAIPNRYAAELAAETDAGATYAILVEAMGLALEDLANEIDQLAKALADGD